MQIVIDIPDKILYGIKKNLTRSTGAGQLVFDAVKEGIVLPQGHGRLIDADELNNALFRLWTAYDYANAIKNAPTVLEADKESTDDSN